MLDLTAEEELLLVVTNQDRTNRIREAPLRDITPRDLRRLLDVARRASRHAIVPEDELFGDATTVRHDEHGLELLARDRHAIVFGQGEREPERASTRHDGDLVQRIIAGNAHGADRVSSL